MYTEIASNKRKSVLLIFLFILIVSGLGWVISVVENNPGLFIGVALFALVYAVFGYFGSAKVALSLAGAKEVEKKQAPKLYRTVENLSITAGVPLPKIYVIEDDAPNAFATGRDPEHSAVAVTTGLMNILEDDELEGVIAHELSHVGNYDIRLMAIVLILVTIIVYVSDFFLRMTFWGGGDSDNKNSNAIAVIVAIGLAVLAPIIATLLKLAVSRKREYLADASGALLTRYPDGLARALKKIGSYPRGMRHSNSATAHMYFANPLRGKKGGGAIASLFSTHPPIEERIKRLNSMGGEL